MNTLPTHLRADDPAFQHNAAHYRALVEELHLHLASARAGGGATAQARHRAQGKLLARERIDALLDAGSCWMPDRRFWKSRRWQATPSTMIQLPRRDWSPGSGGSAGASA